MNKYLVLYSLNYDPIHIRADCVNIDNEYTEFIKDHEVIARFFNCVRWEKIYET